MEHFELHQLIAQIEDQAAALTLDQRLRLAALLARPALAVQQPPAAAAAPPLVLTVDEVAAVLKIGRTTVYDLLGSGRLEGITIGRLRRVRYEAVTNLLDQLSEGSRPHRAGT